MSILDEVYEERQRQIAKWGGEKHDDNHQMKDWMKFIHQRTFAIRERRELSLDRARLIRIAALAVAAVESMDRKAKEKKDG